MYNYRDPNIAGIRPTTKIVVEKQLDADRSNENDLKGSGMKFISREFGTEEYISVETFTKQIS